MKKYNSEMMRAGLDLIDGEESYFINSLSLGLWTSKGKFNGALDNNRAFCDRMIARRPGKAVWKQIKVWNLEDSTELGI